MRLIDVDSLKDGVSEYTLSKDEYERFCKIIDAEPTAYDVNKVVAELEKAKAINVDIGFGTVINTLRKDVVLEIVKQGSVSDDCCEWESDYGFISDKYKRETQCGYTFYDLHHAVAFKYCPYCGKKIKVVE